jgi:hypothetical protein
MSMRQYLGGTKKKKKKKKKIIIRLKNLQNVQILHVGLSFYALSKGVGSDKRMETIVNTPVKMHK